MINRNNWTKVKFSDVVINNTKSEKNPLERGIKYAFGLENFEPHNLEPISKIDIENEGTKFSRFFKKGQFLFGARRSYLRQMIIAPFDGVCTANIMVFDSKDFDLLTRGFLYIICQSNRFIDYSSGTSVGSLFPNAKWNALKNFEFMLPPVNKQIQLTHLLNNLENQIKHTQLQEKNLRMLAKRLSDDFIESNQFGALLESKKLVDYKWKDCVDKLLRRTDPVEDGIERIVAGENLESQDFKIRTWGTVGKDFLGPAFHVMFEPGDILFGSRRTYLRKVSFADFKGVCANTTFVVKSKEDILLQDLLKHIMLSERFIQYSIAKSKGSTNPYINWKDLNDFKFKLPDLETQRKMANILDDCIANAEIAREQSITLKKLKHKLLDEIFD